MRCVFRPATIPDHHRDPDLAVLVVRYPAFRGSLRLESAFIDFSRPAAFPIHGPQSHLRTGGIAGRISVLPSGIFLLAAHVNDCVGIPRKTYGGKLAAVILSVGRQFPRREIRPFRYPDVSFSLFVVR